MGDTRATDRVDTIARLSHEVRHPVSAMLGMIELLGETELDEVQRRYVDLLRSTSEHLLALLADAFDPGHTQEAPARARTEFRVLEIVEQAVEIAVNRIRKPSVAVTSHVDARVPRVVIGDAGRLRQILLNVLINALKFTERGEVVVRVEHVLAPGYLAITVSDTGVGIDAARLRELEAPVADESRSGLGLQICRQLIGQLGGTFEIESSPGKGTTIRVEVPVEKVPRYDTSSITTALNLTGRATLVLADSSTQRTVLVEHVRAWGGDACGLTSVAELRARLEPEAMARAPVEIVVIDDHQLDAEGEALLDYLAAAAHLHGLRGVWISGLATLARALPPGWRHLRNPVRRRDLAISLSGEELEIAPRPPVVEPVWPAGRRFRVLLVDDSPESRLVARRYLDACPFDVEEAASGAEALLLCDRASPDLILLDLNMPGMSGIDTARALRAREAASARRARIVFLSATTEPGSRAAALAAGGDAYATKPIKRDVLVALVHRELCGAAAAPAPSGPIVVDDAIAALVPAFLRGRRKDVRAIRDAVMREDFAAIQVIGHTIKGLGGSYGFAYITELGAQIEERAARRDAGGIEAACTALEAHLRALSPPDE